MTTKPAAKKTRKKPAPAASFVPPRIGRPPTGSAMPAKVRQAKFLEDLRQHGGDKIGVSLSPESIVHLHEIAYPVLPAIAQFSVYGVAADELTVVA